MANSNPNINDQYIETFIQILHDMNVGITVSKSTQYPGTMYVVEYPNGEKDQFRPKELINFIDSLRTAYNLGLRKGNMM